ncbi:peptidoglycan-binding domain-containing protein [Seohaeicola zhoushanensis]|uniref:Peptidoglycan binding-like domain-containing protein n=1 Tax=Seohaeicola zhoushanensis TaxID=1569283 RepID=A0A8J3H1A6_9RHOB|nr:peptidoglycan-binding domain-containing protein [Seohaeicola zhoushanensis]GHF63645.1 hypothetical protein GCM10017056_38690 [Seohaeicola zhoushanensis]
MAALRRIGLALALLLAPVAAAADAYVACVQAQLARLGIDAGAADGLVGPRTRAALAELVAREPTFAPLPRLTAHNASVWCGEIGRRLDLRGAWPSADRPLRLEVGAEVVPERGAVLEATILEARAFLVATLGADIPGTLVVIAETDIDHLAERTARALDGNVVRGLIAPLLHEQCDGADPASGVTFDETVALCLAPGWTTERAWTPFERRQLRRLVAHELTHVFERQLVGRNIRLDARAREGIWGPRWLTEAAAVAMEFGFAFPQTSLQDKLRWFEAQQDYDAAVLRGWSAGEVRGGETAEMHAGYAGVLLAWTHGEAAFLDFWRAIPAAGWEAAFEQAFGQPVERFYAGFGVAASKPAEGRRSGRPAPDPTETR